MIVDKKSVNEVISSLKNGKAADSAGISGEHLKYGGETLLSALTDLINSILETCTLPELFKLDLVSPVFKKKGKPVEDPNSYRKITVTNVINKVIEKLHPDDSCSVIADAQNSLQKGFTAGVSQTLAAIIVTELQAEAKDPKSYLSLALLDAQKAFDKLWHNSLLRKSFQIGINEDKWPMLNAWYHELVSQIKWSVCYKSRRTMPKKKTMSSVSLSQPSHYIPCLIAEYGCASGNIDPKSETSHYIPCLITE